MAMITKYFPLHRTFTHGIPESFPLKRRVYPLNTRHFR